MKHPRLFSFGMYGVIIVLLAVAGAMLWDYYKTTHSGDVIPSTEPVVASIDTPSEQTPPPVASAVDYTVPASHPRALMIDPIGVSSFVQPVGVDQYNQIAVPTNVHFSGWYIKSTPPGQEGVTIIDGHVGGRYGGAVFSRLSEVRLGDVIRIQKGDLSWLTYYVEKNIRIAPDDSGTLFAKHTDAKNELHLITCEGAYIPEEKTYDQRSLIVARLTQ